MKIGSIVECVGEFDELEDFETAPVIGKYYTIRGISKGRWKYITLEEIINPISEYQDCNGEAEFDMRCFRELLPPMEAEIKELLEEPQLV